jgi:hypothetical protein
MMLTCIGLVCFELLPPRPLPLCPLPLYLFPSSPLPSSSAPSAPSFLPPFLPAQVLTNFLLPATRDAHHRVRWAALNAIAQLCNDYAPDFERENHALIMPVLIEVRSGQPRWKRKSHLECPMQWAWLPSFISNSDHSSHAAMFLLFSSSKSNVDHSAFNNCPLYA